MLLLVQNIFHSLYHIILQMLHMESRSCEMKINIWSAYSISARTLSNLTKHSIKHEIDKHKPSTISSHTKIVNVSSFKMNMKMSIQQCRKMYAFQFQCSILLMRFLH